MADRCSHELLARQFKLPARLEHKINKIVRKVEEELGVTSVYSVSASLHKLLLYEPGSVFPRVKGERHEPNQFGTLMIQLPSEFSGGELRVWPPRM
jgi:hypothetical protein